MPQQPLHFNRLTALTVGAQVEITANSNNSNNNSHNNKKQEESNQSGTRRALKLVLVVVEVVSIRILVLTSYQCELV